ncbi:MAG: hypothetical protein QM723_36350 [Myxococcaceae bacterium]
MKKVLYSLSVVSLLALSGCVDESPWRITGISVDPDCSGMLATVGITSGTLDISAASRQQANYILQLQDVNTIAVTPNQNSNMLPLQDKSAGTISVKELIVSYTSTPRIDMKKEAIPVAAVVAPNGATGGFIEANVLTQNAADALLNAIGSGNTAELVVTMQFHGVEQSGGDIYSTVVTFPIHVFNSGATCPAPDQFGPTGACNGAGGQDDSRVCCASDSTCVKPMM